MPHKGLEDLDFKQVDLGSPALMTAQVRMLERGVLIMSQAEVAVHDIAEKLQRIVLYSSDSTSRHEATQAYAEITHLKAGLVELRDAQDKVSKLVSDEQERINRRLELQ